MSTQRLTYRFGPLERHGLLGPIRTGQAAIVGIAALLAIAILDQAPTTTGVLTAMVLLGVAIVIATAPVGRRTLEEWVPIVGSFAIRCVLGRVRFRSPAPLLGGPKPSAVAGRVTGASSSPPRSSALA